MTREEREKALYALRKSTPIMAMTPNEFDDYIKTLNKIADWLEQEPCEDCIKIPEGTTNGDVIKAVFGFEPRENICIIPKELCNGNPAECDGCRFNDFWNSPYRKEQK